MSESTRRCPRCGEDHPRETFGSRPYCRECFAAYLRARRASTRPVLVCAHCGSDFHRRHGGQITCSAACGKAHTRSLRGTPDRAVTACAWCQAPFEKARADARHCSTRCRDSERYSRRRLDPGYKAGRAAYQQQYHLANRERRIEAATLWRNANKERHSALTKAWAASNQERLRARRTAYRIAHRAELSAKEKRRTDRMKSVAFIVPTDEQMRAKVAYWGDHCWMCPAPADTVDHVKPIAAGGPHILANMRPACRSCNSAKNSKWFGPRDLSMFIRQ